MKKKYLYKLFIASLCLVFGACEGYLDEIPQNKQKLSTTDDYDQLLNNPYHPSTHQYKEGQLSLDTHY